MADTIPSPEASAQSKRALTAARRNLATDLEILSALLRSADGDLPQQLRQTEMTLRDCYTALAQISHAEYPKMDEIRNYNNLPDLHHVNTSMISTYDYQPQGIFLFSLPHLPSQSSRKKPDWYPLFRQALATRRKPQNMDAYHAIDLYWICIFRGQATIDADNLAIKAAKDSITRWLGIDDNIASVRDYRLSLEMPELRPGTYVIVSPRREALYPDDYLKFLLTVFSRGDTDEFLLER